MELRTEIEIDAPPAAVWEVLTDFESYPEWNPHVVEASAEPREGEPISLKVDSSGAPTIPVSATLSVVDEPHSLEWVGSIVASFVFEGRHGFDLEPLDGGERTRLVNWEQFGGIGPRIVIGEDSKRDYEAMNEALAAEVQARRKTDGSATRA